MPKGEAIISWWSGQCTTDGHRYTKWGEWYQVDDRNSNRTRHCTRCALIEVELRSTIEWPADAEG